MKQTLLVVTMVRKEKKGMLQCMVGLYTFLIIIIKKKEKKRKTAIAVV